MGTYLRVGICVTIKTDKAKISAKNGADYLSETINLSLYDYREEEDFLVWTLQEHYLQKGLMDYLREQFELAYDMVDEGDVAHLFKVLQEQHSLEEFLSVARDWDKAFYHFQHNECIEPATIVCGKIRRCTRFKYEMIEFLNEGKVMMECDRILNYFERLLRMQQEKHPLAGATRIYIE